MTDQTSHPGGADIENTCPLCGTTFTAPGGLANHQSRPRGYCPTPIESSHPGGAMTDEIADMIAHYTKPLPRSDDLTLLCLGFAVTTCCGKSLTPSLACRGCGLSLENPEDASEDDLEEDGNDD